MANGMAALYVGASGLRSAQESINTTAHNLSNVNTKGYTRQQVTYSDSNYLSIGNTAVTQLKYGTGVNISEIRRVRDEYLDAAYRQENGRTAFYQSQYEAVEEVESLFDEMNGVTLDDCLDNLWSAMNELAKNPGSTVTRTQLIQTSSAFLDRATAIYDGLVKYQNMLNTKIENMVSKINSLGATIKDLNDRISKIESSGEHANDLRDQRDSALDELSALVKVNVTEGKDSKVSIDIEGVQFLSGNTLFTMSTEKIDNTEMVTPVWPQMDDRHVFVFGEEFNSINNNDIGELKGLLLARGNVAKADYSNVPVEPSASDYATTDEYDAAYSQYREDIKYYNKYISESVILTCMAGLDKLVNGIVTAVNDVLCPETTAENDIYAADGTLVAKAGDKILYLEKTSYGMDGKTVGKELFSRKYTDRYKEYELADGSKVYVRNDTNSFGNESRYTLGNLKMNDDVLQDCQVIPLGTESKGEDIDKAEQLLDIWDVKFSALNPSKYAKENFKGFYNSMISEFSNKGQVLSNMTTYQQSMADDISSKRSEKVGVASDEELANIIKFQNAYNASSRYINVVDQMLEHLITRLGG